MRASRWEGHPRHLVRLRRARGPVGDDAYSDPGRQRGMGRIVMEAPCPDPPASTLDESGAFRTDVKFSGFGHAPVVAEFEM